MSKNVEKKKDVKNKGTFWKNFKSQLKKVVWPTPKQLLTSTVAVIALVLVISAIVFVLDFSFESLNKYGLGKIRDYAIETFSKDEAEETQEEITESSESIEENLDGIVTEEDITEESEVTEN